MWPKYFRTSLHQNPMRDDVPYPAPPDGGGSSAKHAARMMASWSGRTASCQIYTLDGPDVVYKETTDVYDPLSVFATLSANDWMYCTLQAGKYYAADPAGCPGTSPLIATPPDTTPPDTQPVLNALTLGGSPLTLGGEQLTLG